MISKIRKQKGLSQEELANKSGVALRTIQRIESGKVNPHPHTLSMIAATLEVEPENLHMPDIVAPQPELRNWVLPMHLSPVIGSLVPGGNLALPIVGWLYKRHESAELDTHGRAVINFQITMSLIFMLALVAMFFHVPVGAIFIMFFSMAYNILIVLYSTWRVSNGKKYCYPLSIPFLRKSRMVLTACLVFASLSFSTPSADAQTIRRLDNTLTNTDSITAKVRSLMNAAKVTGMQVAVFNDNKAVYKQAFGLADETGLALNTSMNIYGASLSKTVFAVLVMKLVEEGLIELDKPLQEYLPKPIYEYQPQKKWHDNFSDFKTDSLYHLITARMCLMHTSGLPNWRWDNADQKLKVAFRPGSRYAYSGEGMVYLQTVIEKLSGKSLEQLMEEKIFKPIGMSNSAYTFLPRFEASYAVGFNSEGKAYPKDKDNEARAPSTLETSFDDYVIFLEALLGDKLVSNKSLKEMIRPQIRLRSVAHFGPMAKKDNAANDHISLSYGLGMGLLKSPYGWGAFKEGHGDGFQHYFIIFPDSGTGILIMTNSDNSESIYKELLEYSIADRYTPWKWQNYIPYNYQNND